MCDMENISNIEGYDVKKSVNTIKDKQFENLTIPY